jgi:hypothetical protein
MMMLASATCLAGVIHGIELAPANITATKRLFGKNITNKHGIEVPGIPAKFRLIKADITTFQNYNEYDILYFYSPLCNKGEQEFERFVGNSMKLGAAIIPFSDITIGGMPKFEKIGNRLYLKTKE